MKIAVTSKGTTLEDEIDPRFGRAAYILIIETSNLEFEVYDNTANVNAFKGAGIQAAAAICDKDARVLLTGFCGPNAFTALEAADVKVVSDQAGKIIDAVLQFKKGNLAYASSANADGHW